MKMRLSFSLFLPTVFLCFHFISFAQDIHFSKVPRPSEDAGSLIADITQDTQGFLWLATSNGLYKYDGYQYTSYHNEPFNPNSLSNNNIYAVIADKAGYIWIATSSSGIDRLNPATGIFTHFRHDRNDPGSLINDGTLTVNQDSEGTIWIGTLGGLDRYDNRTNKFFHYTHKASDPSSLSCNVVMTIYEDKQGTLWVGTGTPFEGFDSCIGGLNKLNKQTGKFTRYLHDDKDPHSLIDNRVGTIFEDSHGNFWVGTAGDGLHTMNRAKGIFERHLYDAAHPDKLSRPPVKNTYSGAEDYITFITEDGKGRIWIGTFEGGINVYDPFTQKTYYYGAGTNSKEKLENNDFWATYKTGDNVIWVGTYGQTQYNTYGSSLYKIVPYQTVLPHTETGNPSLCFANDDAHSLWIGATKGLMHKERNGKEEQFLINKDTSSPSNVITYIEKDSNKFWVATLNGLYLFDLIAKKFSSYHPANVSNSLLPDSIIAITKTEGNKLFLACLHGLYLMDTRSETVTRFQNNLNDTTSVSNNFVITVSIDKKQNVWAGTISGLNLLNKQTGKFKRYLNDLSVSSIVEDSEGNIWCSTNGGLFKYNKESDKFVNFIDETGIITASLQVYGLKEDHERNLWLVTQKGVIRINKERNIAVLYGNNQGVNTQALLPFRSLYILQNGEICFADASGYYNFKPELLVQNVSPPYISINNFLLNNVAVQPSANGILSAPLPQTKEILLKYNQNTFSFEFSSIDFISAHEDTRLFYTLQNYDNAWRKAGDEKTAYYFNLPPGNYVFKVKAINAAGVAAEKNISIVITPPWWETWWFRILSVVAMIFVVYAIVQQHSRNLKKQNITLEEKVTQRTKELEHSLEELRQTQSQLIQSEKMASLGELTAGIAHEIQNPLNFVNNFSEVNVELVDELKGERHKVKGERNEVEDEILNDIQNNLQKILHHGKRADAIVKGMLQHSRANTGKKEPTDINALADEYLRLSYHGMRAKDKDFNAEIKTEFDVSVEKINIVPQDIGRVLLNLFNNAFYAIGERLKVEGEGYVPVVTVVTKKLNDKVEIKVSDNGTGIPQKITDKIFQPFFTTKPTGQGTGLGLSLAYDIIKAHGGEIKVETKEGEGTKFIIQLVA
ncbi:MAG TPA: two-component regulator propeller domain-containing protein [Chitinophagaceae bacterium]